MFTLVYHETSVLDTCFSPDGSVIFSVGGDKAVRMWDLAAGLPAASSSSSNNKNIVPQIGAHDAPIRSVRFLNAHGGLVVSGGWDGQVKFWDARSNKPAAVLTLTERVHAMDVQDHLLVVATADQKIVAYDCSSNAPRPLATKHTFKQGEQIRSLACFPDATGYAIGTITGRVALEYLQEIPREARLQAFAFNGHRDTAAASDHHHAGRPSVVDAHTVNSIAFYDTHKFATTGSEGKIAFWDKQTRKKGITFGGIQRPIPCAKFSADSSLLAYASTDDWSKGCMNAQPGNQVFLHSMATL
jgi:mRNA export factor